MAKQQQQQQRSATNYTLLRYTQSPHKQSVWCTQYE